MGRPLACSGTLSAWQARQRGAVSARPSLRMRAMRCETALLRTAWARACWSLTTQVLYSFCWMRVCDCGWTPPWHALAAQEPAPTYLLAGALAAWACGPGAGSETALTANSRGPTVTAVKSSRFRIGCRIRPLKKACGLAPYIPIARKNQLKLRDTL